MAAIVIISDEQKVASSKIASASVLAVKLSTSARGQGLRLLPWMYDLVASEL